MSTTYTREIIVSRHKETSEPTRVRINDRVFLLTDLGSVDDVKDDWDLWPEPVSCDGLGLLLAFERAWLEMSPEDHRKALRALEDEGQDEMHIGPLRREILYLLQTFHMARLMLSREEAPA